VTAPGVRGETSGVYMLCQLFKSHPELHYDRLTIEANGRVEVSATGERGVLMQWCRAVPEHHRRTALVPASWGASEADVIEAAGIVVTVRRPLVGPGGVS
jgi:hypothetical protein